MCGVLEENTYLFALPNFCHYLRCSDCFREFVNECKDLKSPQPQTSTKLREHIATLSTILSLKNTELNLLADFLGHNITVYSKRYRLWEATLQTAKMSKFLLALDHVQLGEFKGKPLDDIDISVNGISLNWSYVTITCHLRYVTCTTDYDLCLITLKIEMHQWMEFKRLRGQSGVTLGSNGKHTQPAYVPANVLSLHHCAWRSSWIHRTLVTCVIQK